MKKRFNFTVHELMIAFFVIIILATLCRGCIVNQDEAVKALETQGFSQVQILDKGVLFVGLRGCSSHDAAKFEAKAINPIGKEVQVFVCTGWPFKGATVRSK